MKIKFRPKYQGAGPVGLNGIQYVNEDAMLNSQQANLDTLFSINGMANPHNRAVQNAPSSLMPNGPINPVQGSGLSIAVGDMGEDIVNPLSGNRVTDYAGTGNNYGTVLTNPNFQVQNGVQGAGQQTRRLGNLCREGRTWSDRHVGGVLVWGERRTCEGKVLCFHRSCHLSARAEGILRWFSL